MEREKFNFKRKLQVTPDIVAPSQKEARPAPKRKKWIFIAALFFLYAAVALPLLAGAVWWWSLQPIDAHGVEHTFAIQQGESIDSIAKRLEAQGIVRNAFALRALLVVQGRATQVKAGEYVLSPALSAFRVSEVLTAKAPPERDITATIPEGFTVNDIDARLAAAGLFEEGGFAGATLSGTSCALFEVIAPCENKPSVSMKELEGYLFPDTYRFRKNTTLEDAALKMLVNFEKKLDASLREEITRQGKSVQEIVSMASLIEKEVRTSSDRKIVSGILWKRLTLGMALQVDATVLYALRQAGGESKKTSFDLTVEDLAFDSPYNTYRSQGLPPGPIANPGLSALTAAVFPEPSPHLFYLSAKDGTTIFSRTFEEHVRAKARYLR